MICKHLGEVRANSKLFLVEGVSEEGFVQKVLDDLNDKDSLVFCFAGLGRLNTVLTSIAGAPGFNQLKLLGVMLDAETDYTARVSSLLSLFKKHQIDLNEADLRNGMPNYAGPCPIGIYISPGNGSAGRIEDLVMNEINGSAISSCINQYAYCVSAAVSKALDSKSIVQTYISAWAGNRNLSGVGRAFEANVLKVRHPAYDGPRTLVEQLIKGKAA
jgi:hypothetical protein